MRIGKRNTFVATVLCCVVAHAPATLAHELRTSQPRQTEQQQTEPIVVTAVLRDSDGNPVPDKNVHLFRVENNRLAIELDGGRVTNPRATTDADGRFSIEVPVEYLSVGQEFTLAISPFTEGSILHQPDGSTVMLMFTETPEDGVTIDLGRVSSSG